MIYEILRQIAAFYLFLSLIFAWTNQLFEYVSMQVSKLLMQFEMAEERHNT